MSNKNPHIMWPCDKELLEIVEDFGVAATALSIGCQPQVVYITLGKIYANGTSVSPRVKPIRKKLEALSDGELQDAIDLSLQLNMKTLCKNLGISDHQSNRAEIKRRVGLMKAKSKVTGIVL